MRVSELVERQPSDGEMLAELVRVQAMFQLRAIQAAMGMDAAALRARDGREG